MDCPGRFPAVQVAKAEEAEWMFCGADPGGWGWVWGVELEIWPGMLLRVQEAEHSSPFEVVVVEGGPV